MNQNEENLIEDLLNYAFDHKIGYLLVNGDPDDPNMSFTKRRYIIINRNWKKQEEIPFIIGHEIAHIMLGKTGVMYYSSFAGQNSDENEADLYSLNLLYDYACNHGQYFEDPGSFVQAYGIPSRMNNAAQDLFKRKNDISF